MPATDTPPIVAALLLALLQGITEFLPVSSSGHLAAAELVWPQLAHPGVTLELALHLGTTGAVLVYYRRLVGEVLRGALNDVEGPEGLSGRRWLVLLVAGTIPTALIGLAGERLIRDAFNHLGVIAACLALTGVVLMASRYRRPGRGTLTPGRAAAIGVAQGIAILPGISRSGMTISLALMLGIPHRLAVTFSFLLSVPAILGAAVLQAHELAGGPLPAGVLFVHIGFATLCAGAVGYVCIELVHRAARGAGWHRFAWYCWSLAAVLAWLAR